MKRMLNNLVIPALLLTSGFAEDATTVSDEKKESLPKPLSRLEMIDGLNQQGMQEAFRLLQRDYLTKDAVNDDEMNRAALQGLLERLGYGATLVPRKDVAVPTFAYRMVSEMITDEVAYIRPAIYDGDELAAVDEALESFVEYEAKTLVIDLRVPDADGAFEQAAAFLKRFCPPGRLFYVRKPGEENGRVMTNGDEPTWTGDLVLLIDQETGKLGETVAGVLMQVHPDLLVIGEKTKGLAVDYEEVAISEGANLRFAIAEMVLPDETSLFQKGLQPTLETKTDPRDKAKIFTLSQQKDKTIKSHIFDRQRPRLNEAALVAGTNPELGYLIQKSKGEESAFDKKPLQDRVLQQAIDLLTATDFLEN